MLATCIGSLSSQYLPLAGSVDTLSMVTVGQSPWDDIKILGTFSVSICLLCESVRSKWDDVKNLGRPTLIKMRVIQVRTSRAT